MLSLVNDLLDYRLIQNNKMMLKSQMFVPKEVFDFILRLFASQVELAKA